MTIECEAAIDAGDILPVNNGIAANDETAGDARRDAGDTLDGRSTRAVIAFIFEIERRTNIRAAPRREVEHGKCRNCAK